MANDDIRIDVELGRGRTPQAREPEGKFRIALLGDFSGRASRGLPPRKSPLKPLSIDPGNFEEVMERLGVELHLATGSDPFVFRFAELDDFHPDHIYRTLPLFQSMKAARKELANVGTTVAAPPPVSAPAPSPQTASAGLSFLDAIADATEEIIEEPRSKGDLFDQAIRGIASRHATPKADPHHDQLSAQLDSAAGEAMRTVLGHPAFQELEAAWRSVFVLMQHLDVRENLDICLFDITKAELAADPAGVLSNDSWSVIAGLYTFSPSGRDCAILARLGAIAAAAGAPLLSAVEPRVMGCASIGETPDTDDWDQPLDDASRTAWEALRASQHAAWLGLMMPGFLLRLPYGRKTSPVDTFEFEEMPDGPVHDAYLWGNPAVAAACLLAQAFQRSGWDMHPGEVNRLTHVPVHVYDGEATPPAQIWLTERFAERMLDEGVMPLASVKNSNAVQVVRFQSAAKPAKLLAGPWQ